MMRSFREIGRRPASLPLAADDIIEFHAARLLLLFLICGTAGRIEGLTKMAKLDFFARYPDFFEAAKGQQSSEKKPSSTVESAMVRHHYGPWDKRYYHILAHLEGRQLITVTKVGKAFQFVLTDAGRERAKALAERQSFQVLVGRMKEIKKALGNKSGSALKSMIYSMFDREVGQRPLGEVIEK